MGNIHIRGWQRRESDKGNVQIFVEKTIDEYTNERTKVITGRWIAAAVES